MLILKFECCSCAEGTLTSQGSELDRAWPLCTWPRPPSSRLQLYEATHSSTKRQSGLQNKSMVNIGYFCHKKNHLWTLFCNVIGLCFYYTHSIKRLSWWSKTLEALRSKMIWGHYLYLFQDTIIYTKSRGWQQLPVLPEVHTCCVSQYELSPEAVLPPPGWAMGSHVSAQHPENEGQCTRWSSGIWSKL